MMQDTRCDPYEDIIHLPHPVSKTRPQMPISDRAAQFSPFAALTGYDAAIRETARLTDKKLVLDEETCALLDRKQQYLCEIIAEKPEITVTYFVPDERKDGGSYVTVTGKLRRIDFCGRLLVLSDGRSIPLDDISGLESERFDNIV